MEEELVCLTVDVFEVLIGELFEEEEPIAALVKAVVVVAVGWEVSFLPRAI